MYKYHVRSVFHISFSDWMFIGFNFKCCLEQGRYLTSKSPNHQHESVIDHVIARQQRNAAVDPGSLTSSVAQPATPREVGSCSWTAIFKSMRIACLCRNLCETHMNHSHSPSARYLPVAHGPSQHGFAHGDCLMLLLFELQNLWAILTLIVYIPKTYQKQVYGIVCCINSIIEKKL